MAYRPPTGATGGYAGGGVSYYRPRRRKVTTPHYGPTPTTGYAGGGVTWKPIPVKQQVKLVPTGGGGVKIVHPTVGGGKKGGGAGGKGGGGKGLTLWEQAVALANKALGPSITATTAEYDRERAARLAAIKDATAQYVAATKGYAPQVAAAYRTAQGAQSAGDSALASLLQGQGAQQATDLTAKLGGAAGTQDAAALGAIGRGAAAAGYGVGSADLDKLLSQGASAADYGAKLPGLAALTGLRDTSSTAAAIGRAKLDALAKLRASGSENALSLYESMAGRRATAAENQKSRDLQMKLAIASGLADAGTAGGKLDLANRTLQERIDHDRAIENNASASIEQRRQAAADRLEAEKLRKQKTATNKQGIKERQRQSAFYSTRKSAFGKAATWKSAAGGGGGSDVGYETAGGGRFHPRDYGEAYKRLYTLYAPQLITQYGFKEKAVRHMIAAAARSYMKPVAPGVRPGPPSGGRQPTGG